MKPIRSVARVLAPGHFVNVYGWLHNNRTEHDPLFLVNNVGTIILGSNLVRSYWTRSGGVGVREVAPCTDNVVYNHSRKVI